ncbi:hypothetical protein V6Z11_A04G147600 [Gossypium hirsutum]
MPVNSSTIELSDPTIPISSPYYLHPNENPSLILVSPALNSSNYHSWSRAMRLALLSKNKLQFVDGSITVPSDTDSLYPAWERCNTMVISWLNHSISSFIFSSVLWVNTAFDIWNDLRERFSQGDVYRISDLQDEISSFKQDDRSVTDYFTELKIFWDELLHFRPLPRCSCNTPCSCGVLTTIKRYHDDDYVIHFLKGLNDKFTGARSQIMLLDPLPSINKAFSMVIKQERQFNTGSSKVFVNNLSSSDNTSSVNAVTKRFDASSSTVDKRWCIFCQRPRHTIETCFRKNGYNNGYRAKGQARVNNVYSDDVAEPPPTSTLSDSSSNNSGFTLTQEQYSQLLALLKPSPSPSIPSSTSLTNNVIRDSHFTLATTEGISLTPFWIIDTGATDHITYSLSSFASYKHIKPILVTLPNGTKLEACISGTVIFHEHLCLHDVLYIPAFTFHLLSVTKLTTTLPCCFTFHSNVCKIQALPSWKMIGTARAYRGTKSFLFL